MCSLQLHFAVDKFGSVHVSSPVPDSKFETKDGKGYQKRCLEVIRLQQRGKLCRCLVYGPKQCGKILGVKFATNLKKHKRSTRKNLKNVTKQKASVANSTRKGRKSQTPSLQLQETIESTIKPPRYYNKNSSRRTAVTKKISHFYWSYQCALLLS